jgi:hypothetical protein
MSGHARQSPGQGIHGPIAWTFANAAARAAFTVTEGNPTSSSLLTTKDVGRWALDLDTEIASRLTAIAPATWSTVVGSTGAQGAQGSTGSQGAQGRQGSQGVQGVSGPSSFSLLSPYAKPATSGALDTALVESSTNHVTYYVDEFVSGSQSNAWAKIAMPNNYNGGTITAVFFWDSTSGGAGSVVWGLAGTCYADGGTIDVAAGTAVEVTDVYQGTGLLHASPVTAAITLGGTPAAKALTLFQIHRLGTGADTLASTVRLIAVQVYYTAA